MGDLDDENKGEIEILICSANLGNAQPDDSSWRLWVPDDGRIQAVVSDHPNYPLVSRNNDQNAQWDTNFSQDSRFDLVVFGLQESTFDVPTPSQHNGSKRNISQTVSNAMEHMLEPKLPGLYDKVSKEAGNIRHAVDGFTKPVTKPVSKVARPVANAPMALKKQLDKVKGYTHSQDYTRSDRLNASEHRHGGTHVLHQLMESSLPSYEQIVSFQRGEMRLIIYAHQALKVDVVHVSAQNTGRAGLANKGGIVSELLVNHCTRLSFMTCHLEAHEGKYATRVSTVADILSGAKEKQLDCSLTSHYSFVMGDLNFRSEHPDHVAMGEAAHKKLVTTLVENKDWESLNAIDELGRGLDDQDLLVGYRTLFCNFPPTFKVERQPGYTYIEKRRPSYTDRVLWKANHQLQHRIQPLTYEPIDDFSSSDHKPVRAAFSVKLNDPMRLRPKLSRVRSKRHFGQGFRKHKKNQVAHKERLHLFISDISCVVHSKEDKSKWLPSPFIKFTSDPPEVLRQEKKKGWAKVRSAVRKRMYHVRKKKRLTGAGYPRTRAHTDTLDVDFGDEEIHAEVKTHGEAGEPIDLSGAMMRVTVVDYRPPDDVVVGTFVFNLADLIRSTANRSSQPQHGRKDTHNNAPVNRRPRSRRRSLVNIFRQSESFVEQAEGSDTEFNMETVLIDEPILKNGVETGRVKFKLDTWWMDEATAKAVGASLDWKKKSAFGIGGRRHDAKNSATPVKTMLSTRHHQRGGHAKGRYSRQRPTSPNPVEDYEPRVPAVQFDLADGEGSTSDVVAAAAT